MPPSTPKPFKVDDLREWKIEYASLHPQKILESPPVGQLAISKQQDTHWLYRSLRMRLPQAHPWGSMAAGIGVEYLVEVMTDLSAEYIYSWS